MSSTEQVIMPARYRPAVMIPGIQGVLLMTEDKFVFTPDDLMSSEELTDGFRQIKNLQFSKEEGSRPALLKLTYEERGEYIFEFDNSSQRDVCRYFVIRVRGKLQAVQSSVQDTKVPEKPAVMIHDEQLSVEAMQSRRKILRKNKMWRKLHRRFVIGGMLTEAEFWATIGTNNLRIRLTPEMVRQIFNEKPAVHQAFLNVVPSKMTQIDFWTKYCKAEYLHAINTVDGGGTEGGVDEELDFFLKQCDILLSKKKKSDIFVSEARRKVRRVDPTLDREVDKKDDHTYLPVTGQLLDESQVKGTGDETKQAITAFSTRKRVKRTKADDFDAEECELLKEEDEQEEEVFDQVGCLGTLIETFEASFLPFFDEVELYISPMLG